MISQFQFVIRVSAPRFLISLLSGAAFYLVWMGVFLLSRPYLSPLFRGVLWFLAPIATGLGFFAGAALFTLFRHLAPIPLRRLCCYSLLACSAGAAVVFPFGAMLIVFGMCVLGSFAMLLFEAAEFRRFAATTEADRLTPTTHARR